MTIERRSRAKPWNRARCKIAICAWVALGLLVAASVPPRAAVGAEPDEVAIAISLANMLRAGRAVISSNQGLINDAERGDKGLDGDAVLAATVANYRKATGLDPASVDPASRHGRLLQAEMLSIREVMDENQSFINEKGVGFKGFIPAVFARLVTERLAEKIGTEVEMKVTAPPFLVRNRKSMPDEWERHVIESKFLSANWPAGEIFYEAAPLRGQEAFRVMVPEYYVTSCLSCHGEPKGEVDITGYPKEGASEGDLGGVISITLFPQ
jgi:hypothetical protein